jgi:hypothetical protein
METLQFVRMIAGLSRSDEPDAPESKPGDDAIEAMDNLIAMAREIAPALESTLRDALTEADRALGGDSNDDEHDALYSVRETIAGLLGDDSEPPSPDYDGTEEVPLEECLEAARKLGAEHGQNAASWSFDGNTPHETYVVALRGIREGDPAVLDRFNAPPGIGSEYAIESLYYDLDLAYPPDRPTPAEASEIAQITEAFEQAEQDAFWAEVERAARYQVEGDGS